MHSMFEEFSSAYLLGELYVEPHDGDRAVMQRADHERVNERFYAPDEGISRLDSPLVMKLDEAHFPVLGDENVPSGTLAVPPELAADDLPARKRVYLARAERAGQLLRYAGWAPADRT